MWSDLWYRLRAIFHRRTVEAEMNDELRFHLERQAEKLRQSGMSAPEAERQARLMLGGPEQVREACRDARGTRWLENLAQDVRYTGRTLRKSPAFAAVAVLSLALGIGANTAIFSVLNAAMLKPLPVREPFRLASLYRTTDDDDAFTYLYWDEIRKRQDVFSAVLAYSATPFDGASGGEKRPISGLYASGDYFSTLGVMPALGRTISNDDDQPGAAPVAVLGYGFWQRQYGGDPSVVGRTVLLDGYATPIIGVAQKGFFGTDVGDKFDVAVPLTSIAVLHPGQNPLAERQYWWLNVAGRLRPGISLAQADARLFALSPEITRAALPPRAKTEGLHVKPAAMGYSPLRERYGRALQLMMGMVGLVLLVACANLANLLLARADARRRETAVRMAIGAGRGRLIRQLVTESLTISMAGALLGCVVAYWGSRLLLAAISSSQRPRFLDLSFDLRTLGFTAGAAVLTGLLFGLAPALRATRTAPIAALKEGPRGLTERLGGWRLGRTLIALQVAISLVLLAGAGLFVRSLQAILSQDMGFRSQGVLLADADTHGRNDSRGRQNAVAADLEARLRAIPQALSVSRSAVTPISGYSWQWSVDVDGPDGARKPVHAFFNLITPDYFAAMGTPVVAGRAFAADDTESAPLVAILNQTAARRFFPGSNAIGRLFHDKIGKSKQDVAVLVVGIAKDAKYRSLKDAAPPTVYEPINQNPAPFAITGTFAIRFAGSASEVMERVKQAFRAADPRMGLEMRLLETQVDDSLLQERLVAKLAASFGLLALVLAGVGLYGMVAYGVARRRSEIGIRMALGATRGSVMRLVLRELSIMLAVGVALGLGASVACGRLVKTMLFELKPGDPATLAGACVLMIALAALAGYLPARRASRLNPLATLREE